MSVVSVDGFCCKYIKYVEVIARLFRDNFGITYYTLIVYKLAVYSEEVYLCSELKQLQIQIDLLT